MPDLEDNVIDKQDTQTKKKVKKPDLYGVILNNDDFSHPLAVLAVVVSVFKLSQEVASGIVMQAHTEGKASCGVYPKDIAETKQQEAIDMGKSMECALLFTVEKV